MIFISRLIFWVRFKLCGCLLKDMYNMGYEAGYVRAYIKGYFDCVNWDFDKK